MVALDRSNPFVRMVFDYRDGAIVIDECVAALEEAEARHGLELISPGLDYQMREGSTPESPSSIIVGSGHWRDAVDVDDATLEDLLREGLYPFLTEIHAVLIPAFPDDSDVVFGGKFFLHATARAYAEIHAKWAREIHWLGKRNWNYVDFLYGQAVASDFNLWIDAFKEVVTAKTSRVTNSANNRDVKPERG